MSHKVLIGTALFAVAVLGFAWFSIPRSTYVVSTYTTSTQTGGYTVQTGTQTTSSTSTSPASANSFTLAEVATHSNASSCWSAINGKVYDLTAWINQHPGGPEHILSICGTDGSAAFNAQHGGQSQPAAELATFYIGTLTQ